MGFGKNKKVVKEATKETTKEEPTEKSQEQEQVKEDEEQVKKEGEIRLVTNDQLINFKLDNLGEYIRDTTSFLKSLEDRFNELQRTIEKGLEE